MRLIDEELYRKIQNLRDRVERLERADPALGSSDPDAIHDNVSGEISAITEKASPVSGDLVIIEDSAASYAKKKVQLGNLPAGSATDNDAIHDNVASEISAITEKTAPVVGDLLLIEDSQASNAKKMLKIGKLMDLATPGMMQGRLTLTSGNPYPGDQSAQTTLYLTPVRGGIVSIFDGSEWIPYRLSEISISLSGLTASTVYDIFVYDSSGLSLEAVAWTNTTTRATSLAIQDGVYVKSGATGRRYVGTIYVDSGGGAVTNSATARHLWNYYNQIRARLYKLDFTSHTYNSTTARNWNNSASHFVSWVAGLGVSDFLINLNVVTQTTSNKVRVGLDIDGAGAPTFPFYIEEQDLSSTPVMTQNTHSITTGQGYHSALVKERLVTGSSTETFYQYIITAEVWY